MRAPRPWSVPVALALALSLAACASSGWPDERGAPVPVSYLENIRVSDAFLEALTAARAGTMLPEPRVTPAFQERVRRIALALQSGEASAPTALDNARRWGAVGLQGTVEAWLLDCRAGPPPRLPGALISPPVLTIAFATAHFRPLSAAAVQCAILVVSNGSGARVDGVSIGPPK